MTDIEKIIKMLFPEIMKLIDTQKKFGIRAERTG